jgi:hypothetical protein
MTEAGDLPHESALGVGPLYGMPIRTPLSIDEHSEIPQFVAIAILALYDGNRNRR